MRYRSAVRKIPSGLLLAALTAGLVPILLPFVWMVSTSLKTRDQVAAYPPRWMPVTVSWVLRRNGREAPVEVVSRSETSADVKLPDGAVVRVSPSELSRRERLDIQWGNYRRLLDSRYGQGGFGRFVLNTLLIVGLSVIGQTLSSALVGWGFARLRFPGREPLFLLMLATVMIPGQISMVPQFMLFKQFGWIDTFLPLILPAWLGSAFFAFLYRQYFMGIPSEMDEAARVDGCGPFRTFWSILFPLAQPVTVTVAVFIAMGAWNDFLGPLIYLNSDHKRTLSLALARFQGAYGSDIPMLMAAATVMLIPVLILYGMSQRALMQGMVVTGVKG